jgi:hypothetical protein
MAMIDYGAIVKVNGKIVNENQFFMDMQKSVGWVDYPFIRYDDCDCIDGKWSNCSECPRAKFAHYTSSDNCEKSYCVADCRGNPIIRSDLINGNYFAYVGDEDFTVAVYKNYALFISRDGSVHEHCSGVYLWDSEPYEMSCTRMVRRFSIQTKSETVSIKIKQIDKYLDRIVLMTFSYKGNKYELLYGYGIDSDKAIWDSIKYRYLRGHKKTIKFVDKFWASNKGGENNGQRDT